MTVAVVGAGVTGLTCACELIDRGIEVQVFEQSDLLGGSACSWLAGGMLAPWCESVEPQIIGPGLESIAWWQRHTGCVTQKGSLVLAHGRDTAELKRFANLTFNYEWRNSAQIESLEPDLAGRYETGLFFPEEAHLDPRQALHDLVDYLGQRGVTVQFGRRVDPRHIKADHVLDCRGFHARDLLTSMRGVRGEMLILKSNDVTLNRPIRLAHPRFPLYIVPRAQGHYMVGATMIENDGRERVTARSMLELLGSAYSLQPQFGEAEIIEVGVDVRPAFSDNLPRIEQRGHILHVNGMYRHGFLLGPAMARKAADTVLDTVPTNEVIHANHC